MVKYTHSSELKMITRRHAMDMLKLVWRLKMDNLEYYEYVMDILVVAGRDPNAQNINNSTALHYASFYKHNEIVRLLLEAGANPNIQNRNNDKALYWALRFGNIEMENLLREAEAKWTA